MAFLAESDTSTNGLVTSLTPPMMEMSEMIPPLLQEVFASFR
jgi:hypothetical protein